MTQAFLSSPPQAFIDYWVIMLAATDESLRFYDSAWEAARIRRDQQVLQGFGFRGLGP